MGVIVRYCRRAVAPLLGVVALSMIGPAEAADPAPVWVGTGSCAATSCHKGRREPLDLKGSEYEFSDAYDPHGRAYSVLYGERSRTIFKNLNDAESLDNINAEPPRPITNDLCLRCHVSQDFETKAPRARSATFALEDGVGCEGCHGPAGKWLVPHTEGWWKGLTDRQKQADFGLYPTKDLLARGENCTQCHVGIGSTDMNHDLIAAGHPRLNFEYGSQLAKLPKHWRIADDKARHPDYEAKVWVLGQILAAKATVDLLGSRAARSIKDEAPWPEFSEYSCFSCHHELVQAGWRKPARPGLLPWGSWYFPVTQATGLPSLDIDLTGSPLGDIREEMVRPSPDPALIVRRAGAASDQLGQLARSVNERPISATEARSMLAKALKLGENGQPIDWDQAAQQYLAVVALDKALADSDPRYSDPTARAGIDRLYQRLNLPTKGNARPGTFDSPFRYDPRLVADDLGKLQAALPKP